MPQKIGADAMHDSDAAKVCFRYLPLNHCNNVLMISHTLMMYQ